MSGSTFGTLFRISTFGESHGPALGVVIDGCPAGIPLSNEIIQHQLDRRRPGISVGGLHSAAVTSRAEPDSAQLLSGVFNGITEGTPIAIVIQNTAAHSADYANLATAFRPGHADYTYFEKYGIRDYRGGGRSSGRETAARVAAGAVAQQLLKTAGVAITAYTIRAAGITCKTRNLSVIEQNTIRACDSDAAAEIEQKIESLRLSGDSAGGIVECTVTGVPAGWGEPVFDKIDAELAKAVLSIGAVKGIEFGVGFSAADMTGSEDNDKMRANNGTVTFLSNNAGGILGGITNGDNIVFRAAIKPVPSISRSQQTVHSVNSSFENEDLIIEGRHDVCLCPRIVPVIESMTALVLADMMLRFRSSRI